MAAVEQLVRSTAATEPAGSSGAEGEGERQRQGDFQAMGEALLLIVTVTGLSIVIVRHLSLPT